MISNKPPRCKFCRLRTEKAGQVLHPACIDSWIAAETARQAKKREAKRKAEAKVDKAITRQKLAKLKTNGQRKAEVQAALNRWVVHVRDAAESCISCGRFHDGAWHGGHYRSRGSAPHLSLDPRNVHKQCAPCNLYLHGNLVGYRAGLIARYGEAYVLELEADQTPRHYTADDYDQMKATHKAALKELKEKTE